MFDKGLGIYLIFLSVVYTLSVLHLGFNVQMLNLQIQKGLLQCCNLCSCVSSFKDAVFKMVGTAYTVGCWTTGSYCCIGSPVVLIGCQIPKK